MSKFPIFAVLGAVLTLACTHAPVAHAQAQREADMGETGRTPENAQGNDRSERRGRLRNNRERGPRPPTPAENIAAAQAIVTSAAVSCQVTEANFLGQTAEGAKSYEAVCATGPGYIVLSSTPPQAIDCVLLAGQAETDRLRDPNFVVGTQCVIPHNADTLSFIRAYATEAGVPCTVDQGASIGKASNGNLVYEVGCNGADGYWLEKEAAGWKKTECAIIVTQSATCRYSTAEEAAATFKTRLAGSDAAACDVTQGRFMGSNANGAFWEAKCAAGNGVIVRFDPQYAVQQVYPCETAHRIGGGCTLTIVPPPAEATAAPATPQ